MTTSPSANRLKKHASHPILHHFSLRSEIVPLLTMVLRSVRVQIGHIFSRKGKKVGTEFVKKNLGASVMRVIFASHASQLNIKKELKEV